MVEKMDNNVIIFSLLSWESKLLHRSHMLAKYFNKKGFKVYYVQKENITSAKQLAFPSRVYDDNGITVIGITALPYLKGRFNSIYKINDWIITKKLKEVFSSLKAPLIIMESPYWIRAINNSRDRRGILCYDISDDFLQFATNEKWKRIMGDYELEAVAKSDFVFTTTETLKSKTDKADKKSYIVENGIDLEEFKNAVNILKKEFKSPVCGFIGGLFQWIDFNLLEKLTERFPQYSFVFIGPTDQEQHLNRLSKKNNVYYLGEKDKRDIGNYFASLDIGLIPYVSEEEYPRLKTVNSNKVFQYCYFGYPIVSTEFTQVNELRNIIDVGENNEDFIKKFEMAMISDSFIRQEKRKKFAYQNSWEKRVEEILEITKLRCPPPL